MSQETTSTPQGQGKQRAIKIVLCVLLAAAVGATIYAKNSGLSQKPSKEETVQPPLNTHSVTKLPRLLDLGATKCVPCKMMAPILEELKQEYVGVFDVVFIDVWQNPNAAKEHKINLIPTQIFFDAEGKELFRHEGFFSKEDILGKWKEFGVGKIADSSLVTKDTSPGQNQ